jgi:PTS system galactitol-specific IIC component
MAIFLTSLKAVIDNLGATVVLPIIIFLIAWIMGAKPGRAFRAGVTIGIAFIGINLVIGLMWGTLSDVGQRMVQNTGVQLTVMDVGWPAAAAIAFGTQVGLWVIPIAILVNIVLLLTKVTKTLNIDVWNYWHFAFIGSLVAIASRSLLWGLVASAVAAAMALFFGDWTAKAVQSFYNLPGISIPHMTTAPGVLFAIGTNWVVGKIPGLKKIDANPETIQKRFGTFGDPIILGLIIGLVLGFAAYYNAGDFTTVLVKTLQTGMNLAAVMLLLPRMVQILMEGLIPVSEAAREFMQRRASGREIYIGLDSAILIGHPAAISTALLLVPTAIVMSLILPGNRVLLFADLAVIPFVVALFAPLMRGNIFRMWIAGVIALGIGFYIATNMAPLITQSAADAGFAMPENASQITSIADGFLWPPFLFARFGSLFGGFGVIVIAVVLAVAWYFYLHHQRAWNVLAGAPKEEVGAAAD